MKLLMILAGLAGVASAPGGGGDKTAPDTQSAAIIADCNARKFETSAELEKDGEKRIVKLKLCAAKDEDEAAWLKTLEDAKAKIASHPDISADSKVKIAAELEAEIARIKADAVSPGPSAPPIPPANASSAPVATSSLASAARPQSLSKPRLIVRCLEQGELGDGGPCTGLDRHTRLSIRSDGDLVEAASLRFLRRGDLRGEIVLGRMRQGSPIYVNLPPKVCSGVASSKVEIQILASNKLVETLGPYLLSC